MLELERGVGEAVVIDLRGAAVRVVVERVANGEVRLGVEAPRRVGVRRAELEPDRKRYGEPPALKGGGGR